MADEKISLIPELTVAPDLADLFVLVDVGAGVTKRITFQNLMTLMRLGTSTYKTVQHLQDIFHSTGYSSGGVITDAVAANTVDVTAGTGTIRDANSKVATLLFFDWSESLELSVPNGTTRYIGVEYNGGSPQVVARTSDNFNRNTDFILGIAINEGSAIHIVNAPHAVGDHAGLMVQRFHEIVGSQRDNETGGLILGETGTRNITLTAGNIWTRLTKSNISALDTSISDNFDRYYRDGGGGFIKESDETQWDNLQYDDGSGSLVTLGTNNYAIQWFYIEPDNGLVCVYGTIEHNSAAEAETEAPPSDVPDRISKLTVLLGGVVFKKSDATVTSIISAFTTVFGGASVSDHGNLGGLLDDDHTQYVLVDGSRDLTLARIAGSTFSTVQHLQDIFHSAGWVSGGAITDDTDGTISVVSGSGLIRATNNETAEILFTDWASEAGTNVDLVDNDTNWIYVEYNAGNPRVIATIIERTDFNTNILLAVIYREGTTLHINEATKHVVGDHANSMIRRLKETITFAQVSGGILSETGTRNIILTAGSFWEGLTKFSTSALDTSAAGVFSYWYNNGSWIEVTGQTQIHQTNYNDFGVGLATLSNNNYGVHWIYLEVGGGVSIVYGIGNYTLIQALDTQPLAAIPPHLLISGILAGKIIIKKSDVAFIQVESAFQTVFTGSLAQDHSNLGNLNVDDHVQYLLGDASRALTGILKETVTGGITAGTTQTQAGATGLISSINDVTTVGTIGDGVRLQTAVAGVSQAVINNGANSMQVYPATSDTINGGTVDVHVDQAAGTKVIYKAINDTNWESFP